MPDETGKTREEKHELFDQPPPPPLIIPPEGEYLWNWYWSISNSLRRVTDGVANPIPPSEYKAWKEITGNIVWPSEFEILRKMDSKFCEMTGQELQDYYNRKFPPKEGKA